MTNVYKIELFVIDHDIIGVDEIKEILENTRYPNRCISPHVTNIEGKDIGEWDDSNPLNYTTTQKQELANLFSQWQPITTAPRDGTEILVTNNLEVSLAKFKYDGWVYCSCYNLEFTPLYWQSLPKPPQLWHITAGKH